MRESWLRFHPLTAQTAPSQLRCVAGEPNEGRLRGLAAPAAVSASEADRGAAWNQATPRRHLVCISGCFVRESSIVRAQGRVDL